MKKHDLICIGDLTGDEIRGILDLAAKMKADKASYADSLKRKSIGLIFQKPSNRTRVSFEIGMTQLGGYALYLGPAELGLGGREAAKDIARVLARYLDGLVARTYKHEDVVELARYADVPVINGLSDRGHPCQALADLFTIREKTGRLTDLTVAYVGDGNNVLHSLMAAAAKVGLGMKIATPEGYAPDPAFVSTVTTTAQVSGAAISLMHDPREAVRDADIVYTDVWASMGQEAEAATREKAFKGFQVNETLLGLAKKGCLVMHCLPAHRGQEITDEVIDSPLSVVYDQAENRMHVQKAILVTLLRQ